MERGINARGKKEWTKGGRRKKKRTDGHRESEAKLKYYICSEKLNSKELWFQISMRYC